MGAKQEFKEPDDDWPGARRPEGKKPSLKKIRYTQAAMIDEIVACPEISQGELAERFGFSQAWVSIIVNSDAFKSALAARKAEFVDPILRASVEDRLEGLAKRALDKLSERLENPNPIKVMELVSIAKLGVGDRANRPSAPTQQNNLYVVALPPPAKNSDSWLASTRPPGAVEFVEEVKGGLLPDSPPKKEVNPFF